jgi:hypothetical protein
MIIEWYKGWNKVVEGNNEGMEYLSAPSATTWQDQGQPTSMGDTLSTM